MKALLLYFILYHFKDQEGYRIILILTKSDITSTLLKFLVHFSLLPLHQERGFNSFTPVWLYDQW